MKKKNNYKVRLAKLEKVVPMFDEKGKFIDHGWAVIYKTREDARWGAWSANFNSEDGKRIIKGPHKV